MRYYFVLASLPPLTFGAVPDMSFKELRSLASENFSHSDFRAFEQLLGAIDLYNVKALWLGAPLDDRGTLSPKELEEALLIREGIPAFLIDFIERYESKEERLRNFSSLYASLYNQIFSGFLGFYYTLEREARLVLTALRAKKSGHDIVKELRFEDPLDPFVAAILAQKDVSDYTPPPEYDDLKLLFVENGSDPSELMRAFTKYRFKKFEEYGETEMFSLDQILAYAARLLMIENWNAPDAGKVSATLEELSKYG